MIRIKLFGLFIAFALLALVRPRKCLELLEAADRGAFKTAVGERAAFEKAMNGARFFPPRTGLYRSKVA